MRRLAVLLLLLPLAACGGGDDGEGAAGGGELTVLAAASLTDVFQQLADVRNREETPRQSPAALISCVSALFHAQDRYIMRMNTALCRVAEAPWHFGRTNQPVKVWTR